VGAVFRIQGFHGRRGRVEGSVNQDIAKKAKIATKGLRGQKLEPLASQSKGILGKKLA
jgi:hypothetical protein